MKHLGKRFLALIVCFTMVVSVLSQGAMVSAAEAEYQIYPTPHEMTYEKGDFEISSEVNVVYDSAIDQVTKDRMDDVLAIKGKTAVVSDKKANGKTNILVGVYGSGEYVDTYAQEKYSIDEDVFEKYASHYVISKDDEIIVLGVDTDAAFYGITSLKHIFTQMDGSEIRNFTIEDYADTNIRGFIEGYYGIPWSNEDRMSLMEFGGEFKMTSYVFAPKDDPYHTSKWRELYPEEEIQAIAEMAELGNSVKCRFVWTAHPFMGGFNSGNVPGEIAALLAKFDQLYDAGVRQFGVLGDDVGALDKNVVIQVMNAVSEWAKAKGDVYDSVFCPAGYNHAWQGNYSELNTYDAGFPEDVQIFWTGEAVCQPVEQKTLDHFRKQNATNGTRRAPLFWLNWPVNDINGERLMMGKGSLLQTNINVEDLVGVVTNPMQEAEASKVALFAVADYAWNVADFDDDQSWEDSFAYIDADASEELHTVAKHMSNPQPNGHGLILAESEELQPVINTFKTKLASGVSLKEAGTELAAEMDIIIEACEQFHAKSKNENLKDELLPFTGSLKDLATAIKNYALAAVALEEENGAEAFGYFSEASIAHTNSTKHARQGLNNVFYVTPGSTHLIPLANTIKDAIADEVTAFVLGGEGPAQLSATTNLNGFYEGNINNIIDGSASTHAWYNGYEAAGQYYQVNLSKPSTVYGIEILNGTGSKPLDTFGKAEVQYTTDGSTWTSVHKVTDYQASVSVIDIELADVIAVRYICTGTGTGNKWPSMREFSLDLNGTTVEAEVYTNVEELKDTAITTGFDEFKLAPVENVVLEKDEYIGLKFSRIHEIEGIAAAYHPETLVVEVSMNGEEWTSIMDDFVTEARYVRIRNAEEKAVEIELDEFVVETVEYEEKSVESTNYTSFDGQMSSLFDGDWTTAYQFANSQNAGKYITFDLGSEIELDSFKAVCTDGEWDFPRHGKFSVSLDGEEWEEIMTLGNQDSANEGEAEGSDNINDVLPDHEISYNTKSVKDLNLIARYLKFEITKTKVGPDKWVRFQEFEINDGAYIPEVNDPTVAGAEEAQNNLHAYMTDKDISTYFTWDGEMIYHESEDSVSNTVKFVQTGISNANVYVRLAGGADYYRVGKLSKTICEFAIDGSIVDVKVVSKNAPVSVTEIMFSYTEDVPEFKPTEDVLDVFGDLKDGAWYVEGVQFVYDEGLMNGNNGSFKPSDDITRAQIVTILYRLAGSPEVTDRSALTDFTDVVEEKYYTDAVCWAYANGIATGNDRKFNPAGKLTRQQMAAFFFRYAEFAGLDTAVRGDLSSMVRADEVSEYAEEAVEWAVGTGLISGSELTVNGNVVKDLNPRGNTTRAQVATILMRFCEGN